MRRSPHNRFGMSPQGFLGLVGLAIASLVLAVGLTGQLPKLFDSADRQIVRATFATTQQLRVGDDVRIDGVSAGKVERIELASNGRHGDVELAVDRSAGEVFADARARLRWKTVLGGSFYVDLQRGTPSRGPLGARSIPIDRTGRQVELDDVTAIVEGGARRGLQRLPKPVADGLRNPEALSSALDGVARKSPDLAGGLAAVRGSAPATDLRQLVKETAGTVEALRRPQGALRQTVSGLGVVLRTTARRQAEIEATLIRSPAVMDEARATLARLRSTLEPTDQLLRTLKAPAGDVAPTLSALRPTVTRADRLLDDARPLLGALRPAARFLAGAARGADPLLVELQPSIDRLEQNVLPMLSEVDPGTQKSTAVMIGGATAAVGSGAVGQMDVNGHFIRFPATSGSTPFYSLPCQTYLANPDKAQLAECQSLSKALDTYLNYSPLTPTPGTDADGDGEIDPKGTR